MRDNHVARGHMQTGVHRGGLAKVTAEANNLDPPVCGGQSSQFVVRAVVRAVVYEQQFVVVPKRVEDGETA